MIIKIKGIAKNILMSAWPYRILRFGLAALFIYGGVIKLFDPKNFARTISSYDLVPEMLLPFVAVGLPLLETVAGIALLFNVRGSLAVISGLLGLFVFVLGYGIMNDLNVDCGCFGAEELLQQDSLRQAFYRDLFLAGIIVPYLYMSRWVRNRAVLAVQEQTGKNKGDKNL
ncbi:MAG: MauE/DoxX family redox-associated membrane protein [Deltaproteobacteria bacterium]